MAAALAPQDLTEDSICPNVTQNIFVVCTPSERNARAYTTVQQLRMRETLYRVAVYPAPPDDTCKGVIRGIDIDLNDNQLRELIVTKRNPSALEVKRIKNTMTVTILFQGMQTPSTWPQPLPGTEWSQLPRLQCHLEHLRGIQEKPLCHTGSETSQRPPQPLQLQGTLPLPPGRADMGGPSPREATTTTEPTN
ncbi:hypothetical protein MTO96_044352 [Rhipicephalus appendiculatus]